ncbi:uncharacterized protein PG986_000209 [Apiospora aurea]|uniref:RGS domain-containing protein n=1 Tax=Apiospora aurea TaxID=335848 RepID=A0ABR1QTC6_9PEZI
MTDPRIVYSPLGWTWIGLMIVWTLAVLAAIGFLVHHRRLPFLQLRRLPLVFSAIVILHVYAASCLLALTIGPTVPCDAQFWVMSIYLPFGMALLQAANSQFQHVATRQRKYAQFSTLEDRHVFDRAVEVDPGLAWWKRGWRKIQKANEVDRVLIYIGFGMGVQLALTFLIYFGSEMFHPSYGFFHLQVPGTEQQRATLCFTGWEWWLSIVWQFFWAWVYAPYTLWKTRHIHDTYGWRIQTICCCIAGLPASPMWLIGLYVPQMEPINEVFPPPQWIATSIFLIEVFTLGFPCLQVYRTHNLQQETLDTIAAWEKRNQILGKDLEAISTNSAGLAGSSLGGRSTAGKSSKSGKTASTSHSRDSTLTMGALENALRTNPQPLLEFASLKDFSGENVSFLSHVGDWRRAWTSSTSCPADKTRDQFVRAVRIYSHFVSLEYSEFPVNISSRTAKALHALFHETAQILNRRRRQSHSATPFDRAVSGLDDSDADGGGPGDLEATLGKANLESVTQMAELSMPAGYNNSRSNNNNSNRHDFGDLAVPDAFNPQVFEAAEGEIKYLVLTNTWPKFVHAGFEQASQSSKEDRDYGDKPRAFPRGLLCV